MKIYTNVHVFFDSLGERFNDVTARIIAYYVVNVVSTFCNSLDHKFITLYLMYGVNYTNLIMFNNILLLIY